jgi:hypothetical protein
MCTIVMMIDKKFYDLSLEIVLVRARYVIYDLLCGSASFPPF